MLFNAVFSLATTALVAFAADLSVNTPSAVVQCKEVVITWAGGKGPYTLSVLDGDDPCDKPAVIDNLAQTSDTWFHWDAPTLSPGTKVIFSIEDSTGDEEWSNEVTIQQGSTSTCTASVSASGSGSASSGAATPTASVVGTTVVVPPAQGTNGVVNPASGPSSTPGAIGATGGALSMRVGLAGVGVMIVGLVSAVVLL